MGAYLMAFPDDLLECVEYHCHVDSSGDQWRCQISSTTKKKVERFLEGSRICIWEYSDPTTLFVGQNRSTQEEAAKDAREWCHKNGINYYMGPIISGMIGVRNKKDH